MIINFDYQGKMICEFQLMLQVNNRVHFLHNSYNYISDVIKACTVQEDVDEASRRCKLIEALTKGFHMAVDSDAVFDSNSNNPQN